jgi:hypothetical protein
MRRGEIFVELLDDQLQPTWLTMIRTPPNLFGGEQDSALRKLKKKMAPG